MSDKSLFYYFNGDTVRQCTSYFITVPDCRMYQILTSHGNGTYTDRTFTFGDERGLKEGPRPSDKVF